MLKSDAVELKGGMFTFMSLRLHTDDMQIIDRQLADKVQQAPAFFRDSPVVVDLTALETATDCRLDPDALLACIRAHRLLPIVASVADKSSQLARSIALPLVESGARRQNNSTHTDQTAALDHSATADPARAGEQASESPNGTSAALPPGAEGTPDALPLPAEVDVLVRSPLLLTRPVRSGQQVYARDTDLIIMGQVGAGAEVVADNNIHVYGPLRGRALCGVSGNTDTRIFCQSLEAELVSVAGNFRVLESIPEDLRGKPAQIWLDKDKLTIEPL